MTSQTLGQVNAVLCDLDGVIRHWDSELNSAIEQDLGLNPGEMHAYAFGGGLLDEALIGTIDDEQWRESIALRLIERCGKHQAQHAVARWSESAGSIDSEVLDMLQRVRSAGLPVVLVSNATTRLERDLARLQVVDSFDHIVNSSVIGVAKPDAKIYHHAATLAGCDITECLFVDDQQCNVDAAQLLGAHAIQFRSHSDIRSIFAQLVDGG